MSKYEYNSWPLGKLPVEFQRPEPALIRAMGYNWDDPRDIVDIWERKVADYWGAKYAVSVDCCSHAIFLCLKYLQDIGEFGRGQTIVLPKHTYISVPMQCVHAGYGVLFKDFEWEGYYWLKPTNIIDAAPMWTKGGYIKNSFMCLSMQIKKAIPIGKGGIILTDDESAHSILKLMSYDGRDLTIPYDDDDHVKMWGYHIYQTPEDCARGILLMDMIGDKGAYLGSKNYPDVSQMIKTL